MKIRLPLGYKANGLACGIKHSGKPDLGLIFSEEPAVACGLFTTNRIISGSVKLCQQNLNKSRNFQAIIVNSGNANCFTPLETIERQGKSEMSLTGFTKEDSFRKADEIANCLACLLQIKKQEVLLASTGIIGRSLPVRQIKKAIPILIKGLSRTGLTSMARAITTTDTFIKLSSIRIDIGKRIVTICGLAKGAGMIAPNLATPNFSSRESGNQKVLGRQGTMLCFILSDADITQNALRKALVETVDKSFNRITIDGCMSTNDTLLMMSNSAALNPRIKEDSRDFNKFSSGLNQVCLDLAKMIVQDAEGATKFIQIKVSQARTHQEAKQVALNIANSNLFKSAMFGRSKNFGRIIAAIGSSGVDVKEKNLKIRLSPLNKKNIYLEVKLKRGAAHSVVYTSDLTPEYVKINASYS